MKKLIFTVCLTIAGVFGAGAQMRLTLDEALDLALSENPTIRIAEMEVQRYDYVKRQTWGALLPQVDLTGTLNHTFISQKMSKSMSFSAPQYNTISGAVDAAMPLFALQVYRTLKMNDTQRLAAVEAARASRIDLTVEVRLAFYNILLAEQSLDVLRESEAQVQRTVDDTQTKYDNGIASEYDLLTAQVQLSNIKPTILQTENSIRLSKLMLKMYLSVPEDIDVEVVGELDDMRDVVLNGTEGLSTNVDDNSTLRTLELQEQLLKNSLKVANASRWPTIAAFGNLTYTGANSGTIHIDDQGQFVSVQDGYFWQHPLFAGIRMSVPLFAGLTKMNKSREIKNQISQIGLQRDYARQQVDLQVRASLNDLMTAREKMYAQERTVDQAQKAYSIANTRYGAGAGTILELNTAQLARTQAQLNYSQSIYDYLSAMAEYERVIGRER